MRALNDCGDERKPCRYRMWLVTASGRRSQRRACSAASSLPWMPPKPPLLMHQHMVARARRAHDVLDQLVDAVGHHRLRAHRRQRRGGVPAVVALQAERQVGLFQRPRQLGLHRAELHGVGARLEHRQDALRRRAGRRDVVVDLAAQAGDRGVHRRRVVREVVVDLDAAGLAAQLEPAAHVLEARQRGGADFGVDAHVLGRRQRGQRVELVVLAQQRPLDACDLQAAAQHVEGVGLAARAQRAGLLLARAEALHLAPAAALEHARQRLLRAR